MTSNMLGFMRPINTTESLHESLHSGRLVSVFGTKDGEHKLSIRYVVDAGTSGYRFFQFAVDRPVTSITAITPAAAWYEHI